MLTELLLGYFDPSTLAKQKTKDLKTHFLSCSMISKEQDSACPQYPFCSKHLIMGDKIKQWHYNRELPTCKIITLPLWQESTCTLAPESLFNKHNRKQ